MAEEVETDLFAEQAVLCGGLTHLVRGAFEILVREGYDADIAYYSCLQELRAVVEVLCEHGVAGLHDRISDTARYGSLTRGPRLIDEQVRREMRQLLAEIRDGSFARELLAEHEGGQMRLKALLQGALDHPIEAAHARHKNNDQII